MMLTKKENESFFFKKKKKLALFIPNLGGMVLTRKSMVRI